MFSFLFKGTLLEGSFAKDLPNSPKSRMKKRYYIEKSYNVIKSYDLNTEEEIAVSEGVTQRLKRKYTHDGEAPPPRKVICRGRKAVPLLTKKLVWDFWHEMSTETSDTFRPAKLRCTLKPKIQTDLDYHSAITIISQRNKSFFQSMWRINQETIAKLHQNFLKDHPMNFICYGNFFNLRPFYTRSITTRDVEVCCCKMHLHARRSIDALLNCLKLHYLTPTQFNDYYTFLTYLTMNCASDNYTHISWECTPSKVSMCDHVKEQWKNFVEEVSLFLDIEDETDTTTVKLENFQPVIVKNKVGEEKKHLKQVTTDANINFLITFLEKVIPEIIHHRNELQHYRSVISKFRDLFDPIWIDLDFSENLTVPMKEQPQSLYWSQQVVTVHSGITKTKNGKTYHPYLSDSRKHDAVFVKITIERMFAGVTIIIHDIIIIESDNCSCQYKCGLHFYHLQQLANEHNIIIIRVYGVPSHGKGEVDHVGGTAKVTAKRLAACGKVFLNAQDIADCLNEKYSEYTSPSYDIDVITEEELEVERRDANSTEVATVDGSSALRTLVFKPDSTTFRGSKQLCICESCKVEYGSCHRFRDYELKVRKLKAPHTRSKDVSYEVEDENISIGWDFLETGSVVAVAPDQGSEDSAWFVKITENDCVAGQNERDECGNVIAEHQRCLKGHFLERMHCTNKNTLFKIGKLTFFYRETIFYPFVGTEVCKKRCK